MLCVCGCAKVVVFCGGACVLEVAVDGYWHVWVFLVYAIEYLVVVLVYMLSGLLPCCVLYDLVLVSVCDSIHAD